MEICAIDGCFKVGIYVCVHCGRMVCGEHIVFVSVHKYCKDCIWPHSKGGDVDGKAKETQAEEAASK